MKKEKSENQKPKKYPISKEFGFYKKYKLPFNELVFVNADRIMGVLPKAIRGTKKVDVKTKRIKSYDSEMIKILTFEPKETKTDKILLYVHGGCFVYRGALNHFNFCEKLASNGLCKVVYVDYRLAYKHKYPTSIEDTFAAYKDIVNNKKDNNKILVCGDSAGGCIAVDVVRKAKEQNIYIPDCLMLLYPVLDKRMKTESMKEFTDTPIWNSVLNKKMWDLYLRDNPN